MKSQKVLTTDHLGLIWDALSYEFQKELSFDGNGALMNTSQETILSLMQFIKSKTPNKKITINGVSYSAISLPISTNQDKTYYQLFLIGKNEENTSKVDLYLLNVIEPISNGGGASVSIEVTLNEIKLTSTGGGSSSSVITEAIPVIGGPLADEVDENWPDGDEWKDGENKIIPAGKSVQEILTALFSKELWPVKSNGTTNVSTSDATLVSTMSAPSLTYNSKNTANETSTVEVGSSVSYSASTAASSYTATPHKVSGLTYGYSVANDNTKDSSDTTKSATFGTVSEVSTSIPTLILSGKVVETVNGTAGSKAAGAASKSGNVVIAEGDNKITAKGTSITFTGTCPKLDVVYGCSNLGKTAKADGTTYPSTEKAAVTLTSTAVTSSAITINCIGAYKYFYGYPSDIPTSKDDIVALANNGFLSGTTLSINTAGTVPLGQYMVVAVPKGWVYTSFVNGMNLDDVKAFYTDTTEVDYTLDNGTVVKYSVHWCGPFGADTNYNSFQLTKK